MLSFDDIGAQAIPGLNLHSVSGLAPASAAGPSEERYSSGNSHRRVRVEDKRIINARADVNQLVPFKYKWAWEKYLAACANHWMPQEINMSRDIALWKDANGLTEDERRLVKRNLGFFVTGRFPRCEQHRSRYLPSHHRARMPGNTSAQAFEEAIHTHAYQYIVESLRLDEGEVFNAYHEIRASVIRTSSSFLSSTFSPTRPPDRYARGRSKAAAQPHRVACVMEGMFFYVGFTQILALGRQNKMTGSAEQYQYILRDESMHCNFGIDLINQIKMEKPALVDPEFREEIQSLIKKAVELEYRYAEDTMPRGVLGLTLRCSRSTCATSPIAVASRSVWMRCFPCEQPVSLDERDDRSQEGAEFFRTRVIEYQTGGALSWD